MLKKAFNGNNEYVVLVFSWAIAAHTRIANETYWLLICHASHNIILSNAEGDCLKSPLAWVILIDFDDRTSRRPDVRSFPPSAIRTANFSAEKNFGRKILGRIFFGRKIFARIFSWGGLGGRSRTNHFKKFAKANFLKWCRGGVWGSCPLQ